MLVKSRFREHFFRRIFISKSHQLKRMNILIFGNGKMGKLIEQLAISRGHTITAKIDIDTVIKKSYFEQSDVAIEFTQPGAAVNNIALCAQHKLPIVVGTTGWYDNLEKVKKIITDNDSALLHATNFSIGVNIFFAINKFLAHKMNLQTNYTPEITEVHHTQKLDAPSGTAITTAEGIISEISRFTHWSIKEKPETDAIKIISERIDPTPGTHTVVYNSSIDAIEIKHTAHSREGFALGAITAAEWIVGKHGVFTMQDVLEI